MLENIRFTSVCIFEKKIARSVFFFFFGLILCISYQIYWSNVDIWSPCEVENCNFSCSFYVWRECSINYPFFFNNNVQSTSSKKNNVQSIIKQEIAENIWRTNHNLNLSIESFFAHNTLANLIITYKSFLWNLSDWD